MTPAPPATDPNVHDLIVGLVHAHTNAKIRIPINRPGQDQPRRYLIVTRNLFALYDLELGYETPAGRWISETQLSAVRRDGLASALIFLWKNRDDWH